MAGSADPGGTAGIGSLLAEGAGLYNQAAFWEAHEAWEEAWLTLKERGEPDLAELVQGLILATAAFENLDRGKPAGFATQGAKALHRLREHKDRGEELGLSNLEAFTNGLLDTYLEVQRRRLEDRSELETAPPTLVVDGPETDP